MKKTVIRIVFIIAAIATWQIIYSSGVFPELMFPSIQAIGESLVSGFASGGLGNMVLYSLSMIAKGLILGCGLAFLFSCLSIVSSGFQAIYSMLVSFCDLIPGIALLPLAILWLGIGELPVIFIVIHSILWPLSRSIMDGFKEVPEIYIEVGKNMGLNGAGLIRDIYLPASFASILSGLKIGWARAWRALISAEMVFGTTSAGAGIGWHIFMKRTNLDIAGVIAALIVIILIGMLVEFGIFHVIEKKTIYKWRAKKS